MDEQVRSDVHALNERWLLVLREVFQRDPDMGVLISGLSVATGKKIAGLTTEEITCLARNDFLLIRARQAGAWWESMLEAISQKDERGMCLLKAQAVFRMPVEH